MTLLPTDGKFEVFVIQYFADLGFGKKWNYAGDCGQFFPDWSEDRKAFDKLEKVQAPFTASGPCWQTTRIHGTFDRDEAEKFLVALTKLCPGQRKFRLVKVLIEQTTTPIFTSH